MDYRLEAVEPPNSCYPVASKLPLLGSATPLLTLTAIYLSFVLYIGPVYMRHRKPYNLRNILLVYNVLQIIVNFGLSFYVAGMMYIKRDTINDFFCLANFEHTHPLRNVDFYGAYIYFLLKVIDYIETFFFVLRKNFNQVSFLHVYHHVMMALFVFYLMTYNGAGSQYLSVIIMNTAVHGLMYTYYLITAMRPQMKQNLWWKKYITIVQLVQFVLVLTHHGYPLLFQPQCRVSKGLLLFAVVQSIIMILLFGNFFMNSYVKKGKKATRHEIDVNGNKTLKQN